MQTSDKSRKLCIYEKNVMQNNKNNMLKETIPKRVSGTQLLQEQNSQNPAQPSRKRLQSMSDDEIIEENLKVLLEKKHHEDRQANGRRIAMVVAMLLIFMAVYHAWIRKSAMLAGALVPAFIMLAYGGWVVILAKRDKERRALFEKQIEEVTQKNKAELQKKAKLKKRKEKKAKKNATKLHIVNELQSTRAKRPSFRQKFFRQNPSNNLTTVANIHQLASTSLFSPALAIGTGVDITPHVNANIKPLSQPNTNLAKSTNILNQKQESTTENLVSPQLGRMISLP